MIGRFYGLSGVNLLLSPLSITSYKSMVKALDTSTNRDILKILKLDLEEIKNFLNSIPSSYTNKEALRADIMLKTGRYKDEDEKTSLEQFLSTQEKSISKQFNDSDGNLITLSDCSYSIISAVNNKKDKLNFYLSNLTYTSDSEGIEKAFGESITTLRSRNRVSLNNIIHRAYSKGISTAQYDNLKKEVELLNSYLTEQKKEIHSIDLSSVISSIETLIRSMDCNYFNSILDKEFTYEDYYKSVFELYNVGLIGFSLYSSMFLTEFKNSVSLLSTSDLSIIKGTDLYDFTLDLNEVIDNFEILKKGVD